MNTRSHVERPRALDLGGRGGDIQRVAFRVARVQSKPTTQQASRQWALELVAEDPKARTLAGKPAPDIVVERVVPVRSMPAVQPGFHFFFRPTP